jgi:predicted NBD/HSP70 family sugar kinase
MSSRDAPVDRVDVRRHNLSLILRMLSTQGPRSRAALAAASGLTRATVSSLAAELLERGLIREVGMEADQRIGRPATLLQVDGAHIVTMGVELGVGYTAVLATDLAGTVVYERRRPLASMSVGPGDVVSVLASEIRRALKSMQANDMTTVGITVAVAGVVDRRNGSVIFAPNLGWRDVPLLDRLRSALDLAIPLSLENEANLGALAEFRNGASAGTPYLVYIIVENGVGAGIMADGRLLRGAFGSAGEFGHTTVRPGGGLCACGSRGCWETTIGLRALLGATVPDLAVGLMGDRRLSPEAKVAFVMERANAGDATALRGLAELGEWLGIGLANVVDSLNPEVIVLAGILSSIAPWVLEGAARTMRANTLRMPTECRIETSTLGFSAAALGGTLAAAEELFNDPTMEIGAAVG